VQHLKIRIGIIDVPDIDVTRYGIHKARPIW
jgi:hypothetical protein